MADSTTHLDVIAVNEAAKEVVINGLFDAASQTLTYGRREAACSGKVGGTSVRWNQLGHYGGGLKMDIIYKLGVFFNE